MRGWLKSLTISSCLAVLVPQVSYAQSFSGTYTLANQQGGIITITLHQDAQNALTGSMSGNGVQYRVEGVVEEGIAVGAIYDQDGGVFFEAELQGSQLLLSLFDVGPDNQPDYANPTELLLTRQRAAAGPAPQPQAAPPTNTPPSGSGVAPAITKPPTQAPTAAGPGAGEITDEAWGFAFTPPSGWKYQKDYQGAMLGHDEIAGLILVIAHQASSLQEVAAEMQRGMAEEGIYLTPAGQVSQRGNNVLAGEYTGNVQGEQARARGFGTLSPYGGGAYVIAVTTPEKYGADLQGAAEALVASLRYVAVDVAALGQNFIGTWVYISSGGSTLKNLIFSPDGSFEWIGETSFVYQTPTDVTEGYGKHPESRGRWTVRGSKDAGVITLTLPNGEERYLEYRAESPGRHNRYYFGDTVYFRK